MSDMKDPRVFFAAERTLLAWNRTGLTLMAFGFVIERFGLFMHLLQLKPSGRLLERGISFWVGIAFILLGAFVSAFAAVLYRKFLKTLKPVEIPESYIPNIGVLTSSVIALMGAALIIYLFVTT
jgi:putative membrane protein